MEDAEGRMEYAKRCAEILRKVKEPVELESYLQTLAVQTGFSRDVLIMQMGIHFPAGEHAVAARTEKRTRSKEDAGVRSMPEKTLIALIASGLIAENTVRPDDFDQPLMVSLAEKLLSGKTPAAILTEYETDAERQAISEIFALNAEITEENAMAITEDCLRTLRLRRIEEQIRAISGGLDQLDKDEKAGALKDLMALSAEMARLKRAIH